jgi:hypothetical protein
VKHWMNTRVTLVDTWGPGAAHTLHTPLGHKPEFTLHPRHLRDADGTPRVAHFTVDFPSGYLADGWQGVNFIALGTKDFRGIKGLPPWTPSQKARYRRAIESAADELANGRTRRLEAVVPYLGAGGTVGYYSVRLYYLFNAVRSGIRDLVVVQTAPHTGVNGEVQARQGTANGNGPPH